MALITMMKSNKRYVMNQEHPQKVTIAVWEHVGGARTPLPLVWACGCSSAFRGVASFAWMCL